MNHNNNGPHRLDVYRVSLEAVAALRCVLERVARVDGDLARQLRRAAASVPLNISEGRRRKGGDRLHCWRIAAGSADEVRACLDVAEALGYVEPSSTKGPHELLDRVAAMLHRMTH